MSKHYKSVELLGVPNYYQGSHDSLCTYYASFKQHVVMWSLPKAKILLGNIGYDVTRGLLTVTTIKGSKFMEEKEKKDKQKYKGNL
jgi:hypothetical protein